MSVTYGSLFTGGGGGDLGLKNLGWRVEWMCEIDRQARAVALYNHPEAPLFSDVRSLSGHDLVPVEVIIGGFPCQDISVAGPEVGFNGDKSILFFEFTRIVEEMRSATDGEYPKAVIWENVTNVLSMNNGKLINEIYSEWARVGAVVQEHRVLSATSFNVPQGRDRVFAIVVFDPRADCGQEILSDKAPDIVHLEKIGRSAGVEANEQGPEGTVQAGPEGLIHCQDICPALLAHDAKWSYEPRKLIVMEQGIRRMTPVEGERLMGWPDDYTRWGASPSGIRELSTAARNKMIGNGIVSYCTQWVGRRYEMSKRIWSNDGQDHS